MDRESSEAEPESVKSRESFGCCVRWESVAPLSLTWACGQDGFHGIACCEIAEDQRVERDSVCFCTWTIRSPHAPLGHCSSPAPKNRNICENLRADMLKVPCDPYSHTEESLAKNEFAHPQIKLHFIGP